MVRIFGIGPKNLKQRYAVTALTAEDMRRDHPMYQYAMEEYGETVAPGTSNDDGRLDAGLRLLVPPSGLGGSRSFGASSNAGTPSAASHHSSTTNNNDTAIPPNPRLTTTANSVEPISNFFRYNNISDEGSSIPPIPSKTTSNAATVASSPTEPAACRISHLTTLEAHEMPDATYEETYGPAWAGGTIKYVYPTGYQSMRPRSCPWKLSIVITVVFTWLSMFIIGHCSDRQAAEKDDAVNGYYDDDLYYYIEMSWCGSRPLYLLWATSMMITGISAAYASVIGYIKVRDFAVANSRSQPPGVIGEGKSDYYVRLSGNNRNGATTSTIPTSHTIYQSDGTPQFWGSQIYRPTQAAVAVTSR